MVKNNIGHRFGQIRRLHRMLVDAQLGDIGLSPGQPPVIMLLHEMSGCTHNELAHAMDIRPATLTVMLTRMERAGWVERKGDQRDHRISRIFSTEKGEQAYEFLRGVSDENERLMLSNLPPEDILVLNRCIVQMTANLQKELARILEDKQQKIKKA